jgi:hypothetical protein
MTVSFAGAETIVHDWTAHALWGHGCGARCEAVPEHYLVVEAR